MAELLYPEYREYLASRITANNAMMALLAGSRLAAHTLQLTTGSRRTLAELFPAVEHIERFNLRSDHAGDLLRQADQHLASVAIPFALATHEDFVMSCLAQLRQEGIRLVDHGNRIKAWNMHEVLFSTSNHQEPTEWLESFHLLREMRNSLIHAGGVAEQRLLQQIAAMGPNATNGWQRLNGQPPSGVVVGGRVRFISEHVFTAFAVTKRLGREVNAAMSSTVSKETWARVAVEDYANATRKIRNSSTWRRGLAGYVRQYYDTVGLAEADLEAAARSTGKWTARVWA